MDAAKNSVLKMLDADKSFAWIWHLYLLIYTEVIGYTSYTQNCCKVVLDAANNRYQNNLYFPHWVIFSSVYNCGISYTIFY